MLNIQCLAKDILYLGICRQNILTFYKILQLFLNKENEQKFLFAPLLVKDSNDMNTRPYFSYLDFRKKRSL
jgi:hypothetical protein